MKRRDRIRGELSLLILWTLGLAFPGPGFGTNPPDLNPPGGPGTQPSIPVYHFTPGVPGGYGSGNFGTKTSVALFPGWDMIVTGNASTGSHTYTLTPADGSATATRFVQAGYGTLFRGFQYKNIVIDSTDSNAFWEVGPQGAFGETVFFRSGIGGIVVVSPGTGKLVPTINTFSGTDTIIQLTAGTYTENFTSLNATSTDITIRGASKPWMSVNGTAPNPASTSIVSITDASAANVSVFQRVTWQNIAFTTSASITTTHCPFNGTSNQNLYFLDCLFFDFVTALSISVSNELEYRRCLITQSVSPPAAVNADVFAPRGTFRWEDNVWDLNPTGAAGLILGGNGSFTGVTFGEWFISRSQFLNSNQFTGASWMDLEFGTATVGPRVRITDCEVFNSKLFHVGIPELHITRTKFKMTSVVAAGNVGVFIGGTGTAGTNQNGITTIDTCQLMQDDFAVSGTQTYALIGENNATDTGSYTIRNTLFISNGQGKNPAVNFRAPVCFNLAAASGQNMDYLNIEGCRFGWTSVNANAGAPFPFIIVDVQTTTTTYGGVRIVNNTVLGATTGMGDVPSTVAGGIASFLVDIGATAGAFTIANYEEIGNNISQATLTGISRVNAAATITNRVILLGGTVNQFGKTTTYNNIATAGAGIAPIVAVTSQKTESGADANVLTYTPPATAGRYRVSFSMAVSAQNSATLGWTCTYKDSNGSAQAATNLSLFRSGVAAPALTFVAATNANYYASVDIDIDNSATNIVVQLTFTGTSFTAKVTAVIQQLI